MKVLLINGSPHKEGCTYTALKEVADALMEEGVEATIYQLGTEPIKGCLGCGWCHTNGHKCVTNDKVNEVIEMAKEYDGFIFGGAVHYASANSTITTFLDRVFFAASGNFRHKPGAAVVSARRAGTTAALDQLNKYFAISNMPMVPSQYWNMVHGSTPDEVRQDEEGMQVMRVLGRNMAWMLRCIEAGKEAGINPPGPEKPRKWTNFIR